MFLLLMLKVLPQPAGFPQQVDELAHIGVAGEHLGQFESHGVQLVQAGSACPSAEGEENSR